ncbi:MAG: alpha-amylase family glycosyl hydrolase [Asticcacaulis sp.]
MLNTRPLFGAANDAETASQSDSLAWWKGMAIYQIYPRSFADSNGDGIGDLKGISDRLDYVADLGVDGIWISPFFVSPMRDFGYDVADFCDVDPIFGTLEDFDALLSKAHSLGLKVLIDQVYSHTSDLHPWFAESRSSRDNPKADWYVWADPKPDGSPPSNWQSVFGGPAWEWDARRCQYYLHNFLTSQPDLNLHNPEVQDAVLDVARFWLDRGVDGFRLDALNFSMHDLLLRDNPPSGISPQQATRPFDMQKHVYNQSHPSIVRLIERIRALINLYPQRFTVAEVGGPDPIGEMKAFTHGDIRLNSAYNFDFLYAQTLRPETVVRSLSQWSEDPEEGWPSWAFSNHDAPRAVTRWGSSATRADWGRLSLMILLALRGNVFLYQGEELALPQAEVAFEDLQDPEAIANWPRTLGRDGARTPMPWVKEFAHAGFSTAKPWLPVDPRHPDLAVDQQIADPQSQLLFTRQALRVRRTLPALLTGTQRFIVAPDGILAFWRDDGGQSILGVFNLTVEEKTMALPEASGWSVILASSDEAGAGLARGALAPLSGGWLAPR